MTSLFATPTITISKVGTNNIPDTNTRAYINKRLGNPLKVSRVYYSKKSIETIYISREDGPDIRINLTPVGIDYSLRFGEIDDAGRDAGADTNFQRIR